MFNTVYPTLSCPFCSEKVSSGVGFRVGALCRRNYQMGDELDWQAEGSVPCRPETKPPNGNIVTVGYFNCDNLRCSTWADCYPEVQLALIRIESNRISSVELFSPQAEVEQFAIIEMG